MEGDLAFARSYVGGVGRRCDTGVCVSAVASKLCFRETSQLKLRVLKKCGNSSKRVVRCHF